MTIRTYSDLYELETFEERFDYLMLFGSVGQETFGFDRYINQRFYTSREWRDIRNYVISRDNGCDLGVPGYEIHNGPLIHHMNPVLPGDLIHDVERALDPEYLITTSHRTHNGIHYSDVTQIPKVVLERQPGDTKLW